MVERLCRGTDIRCELDSCVRLMHCHHEKTIVIDDRVAFVGGIDLTYDGGDPYDSQAHSPRGGVGWHDVATRLEGPDRGRRRRALPPSLARGCRRGAAEPRGLRSGRRRGRADRPHGSREGVRARPAARRLLGARVVRGRDPLGGAIRLPREPVPLVGRDRRAHCREAPQPAAGRLSRPGPASRERERRRRRVPGSGRGADPRRRRERAVPRLLRVRARRQAPRPDLRPREGRDRGRSLAHGRLGEPQRALALQRLGDERRRARRAHRARDAGCACGPSTSSYRSTRSGAIRPRSSIASGSRSRRSSSTGCRTAYT